MATARGDRRWPAGGSALYPSRAADSGSAAGFTATSQHWYFLDEVDVQVGAATGGTIVAFGDSITDGYQSTVGANDRWPDDLAERFFTADDARLPSAGLNWSMETGTQRAERRP